jgi:hypothetical protein
MIKQKYYGKEAYKGKYPYSKKEKSKEKPYKSYFFTELKQKLYRKYPYNKKEKVKGKYQEVVIDKNYY